MRTLIQTAAVACVSAGLATAQADNAAKKPHVFDVAAVKKVITADAAKKKLKPEYTKRVKEFEKEWTAFRHLVGDSGMPPSGKISEAKMIMSRAGDALHKILELEPSVRRPYRKQLFLLIGALIDAERRLLLPEPAADTAGGPERDDTLRELALEIEDPNTLPRRREQLRRIFAIHLRLGRAVSIGSGGAESELRRKAIRGLSKLLDRIFDQYTMLSQRFRVYREQAQACALAERTLQHCEDVSELLRVHPDLMSPMIGPLPGDPMPGIIDFVGDIAGEITGDKDEKGTIAGLDPQELDRAIKHEAERARLAKRNR